MAQMSGSNVLSYNELETYVENLQFFPLDQIGSIRWFTQHEMLEKLNLQALYDAKMMKEEVTSDRFIFFNKASLLTEILISQRIWREKVFPEVLNHLTQMTQAFPTYMIIFHTVTAASLMETMTFTESFCHSLDDSALDLLDFCHDCIGRQIVKMEGQRKTGKTADVRSAKTIHDPVQQLQRQVDEIDTILSSKSVGILCHLSQHAASLSLSTTTRMCDHHDLPVFLAGLLEKSPWTEVINGQTKKFIDGEWREIDEGNREQLTQIEGQLWIALHQNLRNPELVNKYCLNDFRKNRLMRITPLLSEVLLDQLPILSDMQRYLHALSFTETHVPKKGIIIEQTPEICARIMRSVNGSWKDLARKHIGLLTDNNGLVKVIAGRMSDIYTTDNLDQVLPKAAVCSNCGHPAKNRCSGCRLEWYCRRECQVQQWPKHKNSCQRFSQAPGQTDTDLVGGLHLWR